MSEQGEIGVKKFGRRRASEEPGKRMEVGEVPRPEEEQHEQGGQVEPGVEPSAENEEPVVQTLAEAGALKQVRKKKEKRAKKRNRWATVGVVIGGLFGGLVVILIVVGMLAPTSEEAPAPVEDQAASAAAAPPGETEVGSVEAVPAADTPPEGAGVPPTVEKTDLLELEPTTVGVSQEKLEKIKDGFALYNNRMLHLSIQYPESLYVNEKQDVALDLLKAKGITSDFDLFRDHLDTTIPLVEFKSNDDAETSILLSVVPSQGEKVDSVFSFVIGEGYKVKDVSTQTVGKDNFKVLTYTLQGEYLTYYGSQTHLMRGGNMLVAAVTSDKKDKVLTQSEYLKDILQSVAVLKN